MPRPDHARPARLSDFCRDAHGRLWVLVDDQRDVWRCLAGASRRELERDPRDARRAREERARGR